MGKDSLPSRKLHENSIPGAQLDCWREYNSKIQLVKADRQSYTLIVIKLMPLAVGAD